MKPLTAIFVVSAIVIAACTSNGEVFEPAPGLECSTNYQWTEQAVIVDDAQGAPTRADAIAGSLARWSDQPELELRLILGDDDGHSVAEENTDAVIGALVAEGRRVVLLLPAEVRGGGWIVTTVIACEGYEP